MSESSATPLKLIDALAQLLAVRSLDQVNSNQIARAAGVGVGTFYAHFSNKHELRTALVLSAAAALRSRVASATGSAAADVEAQVRALLGAVIGFAEEDPQRFRAAFGADAAGSAQTAGRPAVGVSSRATERRLRELQRQGRLHPALDPATAARAFTCMQNGVVCWWLEDPTRARRDDLLETLVRLHPALTR